MLGERTMSANAVIQGNYSDLKFVRTRKVVQVVIEIPIEHAADFVQKFGAPDPSAETWVAVARLDLDRAQKTAETPVATEREPRKFADLPLPQQAALMCDRADFQEFMEEFWSVQVHQLGKPEADDTADAVRKFCGITSRAELATNELAARGWKELLVKFESWRTQQRYGDMLR
jgi:hypothetical protein